MKSLPSRKKTVKTKHYNIGQLRVDLWNALKEATSELARARTRATGTSVREKAIDDLLARLECIERYFAFPGLARVHQLQAADHRHDRGWLSQRVTGIVRDLVSDSYRGHPQLAQDFEESNEEPSEPSILNQTQAPNYFEVLIVEELSPREEQALRASIRAMQEESDPFTYELVVVRSFQDALIAALFNYNIHAVVIRYAPAFESTDITPEIQPFLQNILAIDYSDKHTSELGPQLAQTISKFRPELDLYYVTDTALTHLRDETLGIFRRIFYRREDVQELHLAIMRGIRESYNTPFFTALKEYSQKPTGVFHAMPISRGNSVFKSRWIKDFGDFYGRNMFLAETSATTGGLDSLLQPTGPLKRAQEMAAQAYGARNTFFVTNGTSTANKIVVQALVEPGDVVLIDRDCHKSHHYGMVLSGALPVYLDSYPIEAYSMYGAVPLEEIRRKLLELKAQGRLDRVKMLLLTNCTFDGVVYNVRRVMEEILAIKPDMVFLWDEAWFAFASFTYTYKQRTAMYTARRLHQRYQTPAYRAAYEQHIQSLAKGEAPRMPDPDKVRIRVYATQSTHKTLSSFRQGSMIHIWDQDFERCTADTFHEAYMTHTSTSPNYQMLASLDVGRRQVEFEGYELVEKSVELAMVLRAKINDHEQLRRYFDVLTVKDLIPDAHRSSTLKEYYEPTQGWSRMEEAWKTDEFVLDPTKITLAVGRAGIDGDTFKNAYLMDKFNIQVNKTSRNSVLLMTNIGTTRGSVLYLVTALLKIAQKLDEQVGALSDRERSIRERRVDSLVRGVPPLPDFSRFHSSFQAVPGVPGGDIRAAYFLAYHDKNCDYIPLDQCLDAMQERELVSASFVIPYPPGFPVLVPGQMVSAPILKFLLALDVKEIHGYRPALGLKVFAPSVLDRQKTFSAMGRLPKPAPNDSV
ncbi:MAG: aminotransferase class I/II-fold pyridoxal phosphate-dependent enzyme [Planctomycetes bacterium]|nr:aminotransferase class I/II-fold pyridoxal phosphate-dependent enzyme [Planctomycetota bacterium]